jgi:hypothetical protein
MQKPIRSLIHTRDANRHARNVLEFLERRQRAYARHKKLEVERAGLFRRRAMQVHNLESAKELLSVLKGLPFCDAIAQEKMATINWMRRTETIITTLDTLLRLNGSDLNRINTLRKALTTIARLGGPSR